MNILKIFNQTLGTTNITSTDISTNSKHPTNPTNSSSKSTRAINLHNWYTLTITTFPHIAKVLVHSYLSSQPPTHIIVLL